MNVLLALILKAKTQHLMQMTWLSKMTIVKHLFCKSQLIWLSFGLMDFYAVVHSLPLFSTDNFALFYLFTLSKFLFNWCTLSVETNGNDFKYLCRITLLIFFSCICLSVLEEVMRCFMAVVFTVCFTNTGINQQRCKAAAKSEFPSKIAVIKHFLIKSILLRNPPATLLHLPHSNSKSFL